MAVTTLQVTISGKTQVSTTSLLARWAKFQNNAAGAMRAGDTNVTSSVGYALAATGGVMNLDPMGDPSLVYDLSQWFIAGTDTQKLDIVYDKVGS